MTVVVGTVERDVRPLQRGRGAARRRLGGHGPQALPAQLRRVRREPLLHARRAQPGVRARRAWCSASTSARTSGIRVARPRSRSCAAAPRCILNLSRLALPRGQGRRAPAHDRARAPPTTSPSSCYVNLVGGQDEIALRRREPDRATSTAGARRGRDVRRGPGASPTWTSTRCSTPACTTRACARSARWPTSERAAHRGAAPPPGARRPPSRGLAGAARRAASARSKPRSTPRSCSARATTCARTASTPWCSDSRAASTRRSPPASPPTRSGAANVVGVSMPSEYTSSDVARGRRGAGAARSGLRFLTIPIREVFAAYERALADVVRGPRRAT